MHVRWRPSQKEQSDASSNAGRAATCMIRVKSDTAWSTCALIATCSEPACVRGEGRGVSD